jgi:uncharacterized protein YcbX
MLRTIIIAAICLLSFGYTATAQGDPQLKSIKVALLTERMNLSTEQSEKFWPVYNRYESEMKVVWREMRQLREKGDGGNSKHTVERLQQLEEERVKIRGKYKDAFLRVISADQLASMYAAESEFKKMLVDRLKKK